ncbi:MAG: type II secretion system F family protein [Oscillospiraceae bacterium]
MLTFKYKALSPDGVQVNGIVEANYEYEAIARIKETCPVLLTISEIRSADTRGKNTGGKISDKALALICSQFSIIMRAGLPIVRAVELIAEQTADRTLKQILKQVAQDVAGGFSLSQSFENNGPQLPTTFIETIRSGEEGGTLDTSFARLHTFYDRSAKLKGKVIGALTYPLFTCVVAVVVIIVIMVFAVPAFTGSFLDMGIEMPLPTRILIAVSNFFSHYILLMLALVAAGVLAYTFYNKTESGHLKISSWKLRVPLLGKIALMKSASEFANTMSTMLAAGLPIIRAVSVTGRAMSNYYIGTRLQGLVPELEDGHTLVGSMKKLPFLPELLVEMTGVGEETGTLESTLDVIGAYYDNETDTLSARVLSLMEPIIICVLAVVVCGILLAVYLPMFSLYGGL